MLEEIKRSVLTGNDKKWSMAEKAKGDYTPRSRASLDQQIEKTKNCSHLNCGLGDYEVGRSSKPFICTLIYMQKPIYDTGPIHLSRVSF